MLCASEAVGAFEAIEITMMRLAWLPAFARDIKHKLFTRKAQPLSSRADYYFFGGK